MKLPKHRLYLGIDPGATGCAVGIDERGGFARIVSPLWEGKSMDGRTIESLRCFIGDVVSVTIEAPPMMFKNQSIVKSIMAVTLNAGVWVGVLSALGCTRIEWVPSRTWQAVLLGKFPKGESKRVSCRVATAIFGSAMGQAIDAWGDGVADAALLAEWGRRTAVRTRLLDSAR
jgi:hypothetical protein